MKNWNRSCHSLKAKRISQHFWFLAKSQGEKTYRSPLYIEYSYSIKTKWILSTWLCLTNASVWNGFWRFCLKWIQQTREKVLMCFFQIYETILIITFLKKIHLLVLFCKLLHSWEKCGVEKWCHSCLLSPHWGLMLCSYLELTALALRCNCCVFHPLSSIPWALGAETGMVNPSG